MSKLLRLLLVSVLASVTLCAQQATVTETFNAPAGTNLVNLKGAAWALVSGNTGNWVVTNANRVRPGDAGTGHHSVSMVSPATNEYDVDADFVVFTHTGDLATSPRLMARWQQTAETGYMVYHDGGAWIFYRMVNGSGADYLGDYTQALSDSTTYHVKLEIRTATKKVYIDGVQRISTTNDADTSIGYGGIGTGYYGTASSDSTGIHIDNFTVSNGKPQHRRFFGVGRG